MSQKRVRSSSRIAALGNGNVKEPQPPKPFDSKTDVHSLTVADLRQILRSKGVSKQEIKQLKTKAELVQRVEQLCGGAERRVLDALDQREKEQKANTSKGSGSESKVIELSSDSEEEKASKNKGKKKGKQKGKSKINKKKRIAFFGNMSTQLLHNIAQFLDQQKLGLLASCNRFLRLRLTLSLQETPSPALAALKSVRVCVDTFSKISALLKRVPKVESLSMFIEESMLDKQRFGLEQLTACTRLRSLELELPTSPPYKFELPKVSIPTLTSLEVRGGFLSEPVAFVRNLRGLNTLVWQMNFLMPVRAMLAGALQQLPLTTLDCGHLKGQAALLPPTITSLSCSATQMAFTPGCLPALRRLCLNVLFVHMWHDALAIIRCVPSIESLTLPHVDDGVFGFKHLAAELKAGRAPKLNLLVIQAWQDTERREIEDQTEQLRAAAWKLFAWRPAIRLRFVVNFRYRTGFFGCGRIENKVTIWPIED